MSRRLRRAAVAGWIVAVALVGCSSDEPSTPAATVPTELPTTTTTDPYAIPAVIDEAYVNRVLAGLDAAVGDVVRMVVRERDIRQEVLDRIDALYVGDFVQIQRDLLAADLQSGLSNYQPVPGNQHTVVSKLISSDPKCIFAEVRRDYSAVSLKPNRSLDVQWVVLRPIDPVRDPHNFNPTPWIYVYDGFQRDRTAPPNQCVVS